MKKFENEDRIEKTIGRELLDNELDNVAGGAGEDDVPESKWKVGYNVIFKYDVRERYVFFGKITAKRYNGTSWEYKIKRDDGIITDYLPEFNMNKIS